MFVVCTIGDSKEFKKTGHFIPEKICMAARDIDSIKIVRQILVEGGERPGQFIHHPNGLYLFVDLKSVGERLHIVVHYRLIKAFSGSIRNNPGDESIDSEAEACVLCTIGNLDTIDKSFTATHIWITELKDSPSITAGKAIKAIKEQIVSHIRYCEGIYLFEVRRPQGARRFHRAVHVRLIRAFSS